jgi:hypothetical protein
MTLAVGIGTVLVAREQRRADRGDAHRADVLVEGR